MTKPVGSFGNFEEKTPRLATKHRRPLNTSSSLRAGLARLLGVWGALGRRAWAPCGVTWLFRTLAPNHYAHDSFRAISFGGRGRVRKAMACHAPQAL